MIEIGRIILGKAEIIPPSMLNKMESVPGGVYQIEIKTNGISENMEKEVVARLTDGLRDEFGVKVNWISVNKPSGMIKMQIEGSPFVWVALLAFLPIILTAIGIIMVLVAVFMVVVERPWLAGLIAIGIILIGVGSYVKIPKVEKVIK